MSRFKKKTTGKMSSYIINKWIEAHTETIMIQLFGSTVLYQAAVRKMLETNERQSPLAKRHFFIRDKKKTKRMNELKIQQHVINIRTGSKEQTREKGANGN